MSELMLLKAEKLAALLNISKASVWRLHAAGRIPLPLRLGGSTRWRRAEILAWLDAGAPARGKWEGIKNGP